jgi:hypothetical protein
MLPSEAATSLGLGLVYENAAARWFHLRVGTIRIDQVIQTHINKCATGRNSCSLGHTLLGSVEVLFGVRVSSSFYECIAHINAVLDICHLSFSLATFGRRITFSGRRAISRI